MRLVESSLEVDKNSGDESLTEVVLSAKQGDADAFEQIVHRLSGRLLSYCYKICYGRDFYLDVSQDVWMEVKAKLPYFEGTGINDVRNLAFSIARFRAKDNKRKSDRFPGELPTDADGRVIDVGDRSEPLSADSEALHECLELHQGSFKVQVWILAKIDGLSYREIASRLSIPEGSVASNVNRARDRLAGCMEGI